MKKNRPNILTAKKVDPAGTVCRKEECDCGACFEHNSEVSLIQGDLPLSLRRADVVVSELGGNHTLLFNPFRDSGVAVLNKPALQVWDMYQDTQDVVGAVDLDIQKNDLDIIQEMFSLGLLQGSSSPAP